MARQTRHSLPSLALLGVGQMSNSGLKIVVFYCANSCDRVQLEERCSKVGVGVVTTIGLPCSGKVNLPYLVKVFETGADGVLIVACPSQECRSLEGNLRTRKRADAVDSLLDEIGLGAGRIAVLSASDKSAEFLGQMDALCQRIRQSPSFAQSGGWPEPADPGASRPPSNVPRRQNG